MKSGLNSLFEVVKDHILIEFVIVPVLAPLFLAGFIIAICAVSLARKESVFPTEPPWGLHEPLATLLLGLVCLVVPAPYFAWVKGLGIESKVAGRSRGFWRLLIVCTWVSALALSLIFAGLILLLFPK